MQQLFPTKRNVFGNRKVEISLVVTSPAFSAAPIGVVVSLATVGNSLLTKVFASTSTNRQQVPSLFSANWYVPRISVITRGVFTLAASSVCQSGLAVLQYWAR